MFPHLITNQIMKQKYVLWQHFQIRNSAQGCVCKEYQGQLSHGVDDLWVHAKLSAGICGCIP
uniref:Uncharacterized protein n=1 Tax=Setaria italica TaxID=4555 RepID=K3XP41_SETIT